MNVADLIIAQRSVKKRNKRTTSVEDVLLELHKINSEITRKEVLQAFRTLDQQRWGIFIVSRRGRSSRFVWKVDPPNTPEKEAEKQSESKSPTPKPSHKKPEDQVQILKSGLRELLERLEDS